MSSATPHTSESSSAAAAHERGRSEIHHTHRDVTGGWLRPAVFGVTDGLVSNVALIAGVAGGVASAHATSASHTVLLTGFAGLVAGAFSMATGEYVSVASQAELTHAEIEIERREIARAPKAEEAELAGLYRSRGLSRELAAEVARELSKDPETAWRIHAREELGVDPDDLPSPWTAASSSFVAFALGAMLPIIPYLLGATTLTWSLVLAGLGLFGAGMLVARITTRTWWYGGLRQLVLGALAAAVTFGVGSAIGASIG